MRPALLSLLRRAGIEGEAGGRPLGWDRVVIINNRGMLPSSQRLLPDPSDNRGFHLIVLSPRGEPSHYCKFRPWPSDRVPLRESVMLEYFSATADTRDIVPPTRVFRDHGSQLQVTRFATGTRLDMLLLSAPRADRQSLTLQVLTTTARLQRAACNAPDLFPRAGTVITIADEAASSLKLLPRLGVSSDDTETLRRALVHAGTTVAAPQHGDLWPANVMIGPGQHRTILDFDDYGVCVVPLFDCCHFLRTADDAAHPASGRLWLERLAAPDADGQWMRQVIADMRAQAGLSDVQTAGCVVFYMVAMAAAIFIKRGPPTFWGPFRDELPAAAARLRDAGSLRSFAAGLPLT